MDHTSRFMNPLQLIRSGLAKPPPVQTDGHGMKTPPPLILDRFRAMVKEREEKLMVFNGGVFLALTTDEIVRFYEIFLSELTVNSKQIINEFTTIAGEHRAHGEGIADAVGARIIEVPADKKLPYLYLLDSIVKNIGEEYIEYFAAHLPEVFCEAYVQVHPNMHQAMRHLFGTWSTVFPLSVREKIEAQLQFSPSVNGQRSVLSSSKASGSTRPPHGIHINPKYFEAQDQFGCSTADPFGTDGISSAGRAGLTTSSLNAVKKFIPPTTRLVKSSSPYRIGHAGSLSPSVEDGNIDSSPKSTTFRALPSRPGFEYEPSNMIGRDEETSERHKGNWALANPNQQIRKSTAYKYSSGLDLSGPRALISAYGMDKREKKLNCNNDMAEQLDMNGAEHRVSLRSWQNTEEEEFDWEDVTIALAERRQSNDAYSSVAPSGNSSTNHAARLNGNENVPGILPNVAGPDDMASRISPNFTPESLIFPPQLSQSHFNANQAHPLPETRNFSSSGQQNTLAIGNFPNQDSTFNPTYSLPAPEVRPAYSSALTKPWNTTTAQNSRMINSHPAIPSHMLIRSQFGTNIAFSDQIHSDQHLGNTTTTPQFPNFRPGPIPVNLHRYAKPPLLQPNPSQNLSLRFLAPVSSSTISRPLMGSTSFNLVQGMHSSFPIINNPIMPFHTPRSTFHNTNQHLPVSQNVGQMSATHPGGGAAISSLIGSLVAQGLISLPKQDSLGVDFDQDSLKVRHEPTITALYGDLPRQCTTCGLRFRTQDEHSKHMDWHVSKNRTLKNRKMMPSPKWFVSITLWLSGTEALGPDMGPGFLPDEKAVEKVDQEELAVLADEDQNACSLCGEQFDDFYSDETEEWMYRGAVYLYGPVGGTTVGMDRSQLGPIVHAKCRPESHDHISEDVKDDGESTREGVPRKRLRT